jgi:hypothetical protein
LSDIRHRTSVGGAKDGWVLDSFAAEVNITTGDVLFEWHPLGNVHLSGSHYSLGHNGQNQSNPWDFFHINAIELVGDNYLINSRHFWTTYLVSPQGEIIWEINGLDGGDFGPLPNGAQFVSLAHCPLPIPHQPCISLTLTPNSWQHFARALEYNTSHATLSWFANNNALPNQPNANASTGVTLALTLPPDPLNPPKLLTNLTDPQLRVAAWSQGSLLYLPNGNALMGYGSDAVIAEYGPTTENNTQGSARWTGVFGYGDLVSSYRAYKQVWHATPASQPSLVVRAVGEGPSFLHCNGNATYTGFVSWNGATEVTEWVVYAGKTNGSLAAVGRARKAGFETQFVVPEGAAFLQVGAVENEGREVVRRSEIVAVES